MTHRIDRHTPRMMISIILPTFRRFEAVLDTIDDLLKQRCSDFEIIVADQNRSWPPEFSARRKTLTDNPKIRWLSMEYPDVVNARQHAVVNSKGQILLFIDDDVTINDEGFLEKHLENYLDPAIDAVIGREFRPDGLPEPDDLEAAPDAHHVNDWSKWSFVEQCIRFPRDSGTRTEVCCFCTCNGSVRRASFLSVGGFDENFSGNSYGDDYDFAIRLARNGGRIVFDPKAWLIHLGMPTGGLRLSDQNNPFAESERVLSGWIFYLRYSCRGLRFYLFYKYILRRSLLLKRNVFRPWRTPRIVWGMIAGYKEACLRVRRGPVSRFASSGGSTL